MPRINLWVAAGWLLFICSFAIPAYLSQSLPLGQTLTGDGSQGGLIDFGSGKQTLENMHIPLPTLSGWQAMQAAFDQNGYAVLSAATNMLIVLSALALWSRRFASWFCWVLAAACIFNLWWLHALGDDAKHLHVGYYTWLLSYAVLAIGLFRLSRQPPGPPIETQIPV